MDDEYFFKILIVGSQGVGKTSLITQLKEKSFDENYVPTKGPDLCVKSIIINGRYVEITYFELVTGSNWEEINKNYFKRGYAFIVVYDITNQSSFDSAEESINLINQISLSRNKALIILVGNKNDLENQRAIKFENAEKIKAKYEIKCKEISAKNYEEIEEIIVELCEYLIENKYS